MRLSSRDQPPALRDLHRVAVLAVLLSLPSTGLHANTNHVAMSKIQKTDAEWRQQLTPLQYHVTRRGGTERAFTGAYWNHHEDGVYRCVCCGAVLFGSRAKFDSGTGWPSFYEPAAPDNIGTKRDFKLIIPRTEVHCARCDAHLGHVFPDGPPPTGLRYCINSAALTFEKRPPPSP